MEPNSNMPFFLLFYEISIIVFNISCSFVSCEEMLIISTVIVMF